MPIIQDYQDAVRQILKPIADAWTTTGFPILYQNTNKQIPSASTPWARVTLTHVTGTQRTIAQVGQLYNQRGTLIVQIFVPSGQGISNTQQATLVALIQNALRGQQTPGGAFYMNVTPEEIGISEHWYQINVSCTWQYDEVI